MNITEVKKTVLQLSLEDRATLAYWIMENLDGLDLEGDEKVEAAWRKEIRERVEDIKSGQAQMISSDDLWKDLFSEYSNAN